MQAIGADEAGRRIVMEGLAAECAMREMRPADECEPAGYAGDGPQPKGSALHGLKVAVPFAALLWGVIAGVLWVAAH